MSDVNDELDGSPILEEVLGDALGKLKVFHVKLAAEAARADRATRCRYYLGTAYSELRGHRTVHP